MLVVLVDALWGRRHDDVVNLILHHFDLPVKSGCLHRVDDGRISFRLDWDILDVLDCDLDSGTPLRRGHDAFIVIRVDS